MRKWNRQPPASDCKIDWTNPIAKKLAFAWVGPHTGGRLGRDLVSGKFGKLNTEGSVDGLATSPTDRGLASYNPYSGSNYYAIEFDNLGIVGVGGFAQFSVWRSRDANNQWRTTIHAYDGTGRAWADTVCQLMPITTNANTVYQNCVGNNHVWTGAAPNWVSDGQWHSVATSRNYGNADCYLWIDGEPKGLSGELRNIPAGTPIEEILLLGSATWPTESLGGDMLMQLFFKETLTDAEVRSLDENPWQILKGPKNFALADPLPQTRSLTVPQVWTKQPPPRPSVDWSNPLSAGLVRAIVPGPNDYAYNAATKRILNQYGTGSPVFPITPYGRARRSFNVDNSVNVDYSDDVALSDYISKQVTVSTIVYINATPDSQALFAGETGFGGDVLGFARGQSFPDRFRFFCRQDFIGPQPDSNMTIVVGGTYHLIGTHDRDATVTTFTLHRLDTGERDYSEDTTTALGKDMTDFNSLNWSNLNDVDVLSYNAWNRTLSLAEREALIENPWQIYKRDPMHVPIEYKELTFDSDAEERLFMIPQKIRRPK